VPQNKVIDLYQELKAIGLSEPGAGIDRRRHRLPRHRHLQARHRLIARPGR
jgi:hypothetical protein